MSEHRRDEIIDLYLKGKLPEEEKDTFEIEMMEDEQVFNLVRERELFHSAIKSEKDRLETLSKSSNSSKNPNTTEEKAERASIDFWEWLGFRYSYTSVAAILALAVAAPIFSTLTPATNPSPPAISLAHTPTVQFVERSRSSENSQTLSGPFPMRVHFDTTNLDEATVFDLSIVDETSGVELFSEEAVSADEKGWVVIDFNTPLSEALEANFSYAQEDGNSIELSPYRILFGDEN